MILSSAHAILRRVRQRRLKFQGVRFEGRGWIQKIEIPRNHADIQLGDGVALDRGVTLLATGELLSHPRISIGARTYINRHTMIDGSERIRIGDDVMIGPFCYITDHDHGTALGTLIRNQQLVGSPVELEDQVWIGSHVIVLKGVRVGRGAVVGAGSVVTKDVPEMAIAAGNPAEVLRYREANPTR